MLLEHTLQMYFLTLFEGIMNIRELEYLVAIADLKHFGKAAYKCFVSQPTLSGQIKKLEQELGVTLFERGRQGVLLTRPGEEIVSHARKILAHVHELQQLAESIKDPLSGHLRLGIFPTLSPYLLPYIVGNLHKAFPKLEMYLIEDKTANLEKQLSEGTLDAAILALPVANPSFEVIELFSEPFLLATPPDHALSKKRSIKMQDLEDLSLLLLEDGHCLRAQVLDVCHSAGASEYSAFRATSLEALRQMVAAGTGVTLIPKLAVQKDLTTSKFISYIPFSKPQPHRTLGLIYRKGSPRYTLFQELATIIQHEAQKAV
jgi:LysR family transcriptional regulator, hydrogen peroxide-inducible genes activator